MQNPTRPLDPTEVSYLLEARIRAVPVKEVTDKVFGKPAPVQR
jgi:hypothetical protein